MVSSSKGMEVMVCGLDHSGSQPFNYQRFHCSVYTVYPESENVCELVSIMRDNFHGLSTIYAYQLIHTCAQASGYTVLNINPLSTSDGSISEEFEDDNSVGSGKVR